MSKKITYIQSSAHAMIGRTGGPSDTVAPGERVLFEEGLDSHAEIRRRIEAGDQGYAHLTVVEVDLSAEQEAAEEKQEMLAEADKIAAGVRNEEAQAAAAAIQATEESQKKASEAGTPSATDGTDFPPQDEESIRLAAEAGESQRASTPDQIPTVKPAPEAKPTAKKPAAKKPAAS